MERVCISQLVLEHDSQSITVLASSDHVALAFDSGPTAGRQLLFFLSDSPLRNPKGEEAHLCLLLTTPSTSQQANGNSRQDIHEDKPSSMVVADTAKTQSQIKGHVLDLTDTKRFPGTLLLWSPSCCCIKHTWLYCNRDIAYSASSCSLRKSAT